MTREAPGTDGTSAPNTTGTKFDVSVTDSSDRRVTLGSVQVDGLPGSENTASYWAQELRVPLSAATRAGLDLRHAKFLEVTPRSPSGRAWLMDAWGWAPGTSAVEAAALPRVDVGRTTVKEGDAGTRTYRIPVETSGHGSGQVRVYVIDPDSGSAEIRLVTMRFGSGTIDVPVEVKGDTVYGDDVEHDFVVPTVHDHLAEPTESMRLALTDRNAKPLPGTPVLTGTVLDKP